MQDRPPSPDPAERRPGLPAEDLPEDIGDALEEDQPDEHLAPDAGSDADPPHLHVSARTAHVGTPARDVGEPTPTGPLIVARPSSDSTARRARVVSGDRSWLWPLISLAGLLAVIFVNWFANWLPFNDLTTGGISRIHPVPFQPAGWAFIIWPLIYVLLFAFVIYSFLPAGRRSSRIQAIGPVFLLANIANIAWIFFWHWERFAASLAAIVLLLGSLATIYGMLRRRGANAPHVSLVQRLLVGVPFSVYLGWISIATVANLEVWMDNGGWSGGLFGLRGWTVIFLLAGILVAAAFGFLGRDAAYPLVFVWGYLAIAHEQWDTSSLISILAGALAVVAAVVTVMAFLLSFDSRTGLAMPAIPHVRGRRTPPATS